MVVASLIVAVAAVTGRDVKIVIVARARAESDPAAIVIRGRMLESDQDFFGGCVRVIRRAWRQSKLRNMRHALLKHVSHRRINSKVKVELSIGYVIRIERHPEKSLLATATKRRIR